MKIRQLMEGQREQIENLRPNAPVALYHPTGVEEVVSILNNKVTNRNEIEPIMVTPSLKSAVRWSDVIMMFYGRGKDLYAPREVAKNHRDKELAAEKYPESFRPEVSFSLSSQRPTAMYRGFLSPGNIEKFFLMKDGRPEAMSVQEFVEYLIKYRATDRKRKQGQVDIQHESTILRGL